MFHKMDQSACWACCLLRTGQDGVQRVCGGGAAGDLHTQTLKQSLQNMYTRMFCAGSFLPMPLQVLAGEFVGYSALFLRTIEGKPTCPQYHKLDPYKSGLVHMYHAHSARQRATAEPCTYSCLYMA